MNKIKGGKREHSANFVTTLTFSGAKAGAFSLVISRHNLVPLQRLASFY